VPEVAVIVICVRGSIPTSTLETLKLLGLNQEPAETLFRKTHISACEHMRRMCHTRRAIESVTMGPQGIVIMLRRDHHWARSVAHHSVCVFHVLVDSKSPTRWTNIS
jgi:hypothetical protein